MPQPDWYLDALAHAGPEHLDAAHTATYDRKAQTDLGAGTEHASPSLIERAGFIIRHASTSAAFAAHIL